MGKFLHVTLCAIICCVTACEHQQQAPGPVRPEPTSFLIHRGKIHLDLTSDGALVFRQGDKERILKPPSGTVWASPVLAEEEIALYFMVYRQNGNISSIWDSISMVRLPDNIEHVNEANVISVFTQDILDNYFHLASIASLDGASATGNLLLRIGYDEIIDKITVFRQRSFIYHAKEKSLEKVKP